MKTAEMKSELSIKLLALSKAFTDLEELLNTVMENDKTAYEEVEEAFCTAYPFTKSFDELACDVRFWTDTVIIEANADLLEELGKEF